MLDSGDSTGIQLAAVLILLMLSAFFSSAETALTTVNKMRVRTLAESGDKRAAMVRPSSKIRPRCSAPF